MIDRPALFVGLGALLVGAIAFVSTAQTGDGFVAELETASDSAVAEVLGAGDVDAVSVRFANANGFASRHPMLSAREDLSDLQRLRVAQAIAAVPGVGGVHWTDGNMLAQSGDLVSLRCETEVLDLLGERTIRFEESSAETMQGSEDVLDDIAAKIRPCLGAVIAITGHTDTSGSPQLNIALSQDRADRVRQELIERGIPARNLRAQGFGSSRPAEGLDSADPANRRIEFRVLATEKPSPTPIDTPAAR